MKSADSTAGVEVRGGLAELSPQNPPTAVPVVLKLRMARG